MKKVEYIPLDRKKDLQVEEDRLMTPQQRLERMVQLMELSLAFSKTGQLNKPKDPRFIELKRLPR